MLFLELNPLSIPVAVTEILLLLVFAAFLGWLIGQFIANRRIRLIREAITERKFEISDCRAHDLRPVRALPLIGKASKTVYPSESVLENMSEHPDDLKVIEDIGPKIQYILNKEGIYTFDQLANTSPIRISRILKSAGPRFQLHDPTSWALQAQLASEGKWDALRALKENLIAGRQ